MSVLPVLYMFMKGSVGAQGPGLPMSVAETVRKRAPNAMKL